MTLCACKRGSYSGISLRQLKLHNVVGATNETVSAAIARCVSGCTYSSSMVEPRTLTGCECVCCIDDRQARNPNIVALSFVSLGISNVDIALPHLASLEVSSVRRTPHIWTCRL